MHKASDDLSQPSTSIKINSRNNTDNKHIYPAPYVKVQRWWTC